MHANNSAYFVTQDQIGSSTLLTNVSGGVADCNAFYPFGEQDNSICATSNTTTHKFTGKERDSESNLDNFGARYDSSSLCRFMSPDPSNAGADPSNPQSWNAYAYVLDNPATDIDPSGLCTVDGESHNWLWCAEYAVGYSFEGSVDDNQGLDQLLSETAALRARWERGVFALSPPPAPYRIGPPPKSSGFTLGIRAPGQSLGACMAANSNTYSIGGSLELAGDVASGKSTSISEDPFIGAVLGNTINAFLFGSTADTTGAMSAAAPSLAKSAMGSVTTYGRRTSDIVSLNLAGAGGLPRALGDASAGVKSALGSIGDFLSLGMSFATRISVDAALTGAEAVNCAIPQ